MPFIIDKYNWDGINYLSEKDDSENFEKNNLEIALNILYAKNVYAKKYIPPTFQNITQIVKNKWSFSWFQTDEDDIILQ